MVMPGGASGNAESTAMVGLSRGTAEASESGISCMTINAPIFDDLLYKRCCRTNELTRTPPPTKPATAMIHGCDCMVSAKGLPELDSSGIAGVGAVGGLGGRRGV